MFVDICKTSSIEEMKEYPSLLGIGGFLFLSEIKDDKAKAKYVEISSGKSPIKKNSIPIIYFGSRKIIHAKNAIYVYGPKADRNKSFHAPSTLNQVVIKEISGNSSIVCLSLKDFADSKGNSIEKMRFVAKLCKKYSVPVCVASFAEERFDLYGKEEVSSISRYLGVAKGTSSLGEFLTL